MIDVNALRNLPRSELVFTNIFSHIALFPASQIKRIEVTQMDRVYVVRICYESMRTGKPFSHCFNFYRCGEEREAQRLIDLLSLHFPGFEVMGDEIVLMD